MRDGEREKLGMRRDPGGAAGGAAGAAGNLGQTVAAEGGHGGNLAGRGGLLLQRSDRCVLGG